MTFRGQPLPSLSRARGALPALLALLTAALLPAAPVAEPAAAPNPAAILRELRSFATLGTVLHIAAHPDDENTQLITYFSRGRGYRTAYLSLTRGDGGQNELGRDFDEKLGVARTQELLAARQLDGGRQFFTRAIDFGYSKSPEETLRFWDRTQVLGDVVRVIRQFRPDVIVTRFPVPPGSGGHGHHTASAMLAVEAFKLAGDPAAYPEQLAQGLTVWSPTRVVWNGFGGRGPAGPPPITGPKGPLSLSGQTIQLDIAGTDPVTGEAFGTIANRSRGMHKTQGLGVYSARTATGPNVQTFLHLAGTPTTTDLMAGIDLTWNRVSGGTAIATRITELIATFDPTQPAALVPALLDLRDQLAALRPDPLVTDKRAQLDHLISICLGLDLETTVEHPEALAGETLKLHYAITLAATGLTVQHLGVRVPGLTAVTQPDKARATLVPGQVHTGDFTGVLPVNTPVSQPYWLRADGAAGISSVENPALIGLPENPPVFTVEHVFAIDGREFTLTQEPKAITQDAAGEKQRRLDVIPPVFLTFDTPTYVIPPGATKTITIETTAARGELLGTVQLTAPAGWQITPASADFALYSPGDRATAIFHVTAPAASAADTTAAPAYLHAAAEIAGRRYSHQRQEIAYDHLPLQLLQPPARARLASFPLEIRGHRVGYLPGAGDAVAESLAQMGYAVLILTDADLTPEKLAGLDAVVIGVRAFNERPGLKAALPGLFAWVEAGGTVLAQYNRPNDLAADPLGPYDLSIQGSAPALRVTDERSPVTFLAPDHPALTTPNKITSADFDGWVQERGAYFPSSWDQARYTAILAMNDPGEKPLTSSVLVTKHGKGHYVYTGLAFFRQLPAGVPGAHRLLANLLALSQ